MKQFYKATLVAGSIVYLGLTGCAGNNVKDTETLLSASGFDIRTADTDKKLEHLKSLQQHKLVAHKVDGELGYVYADAEGCKCFYSGDEKAYNKYKQTAAKQSLTQEQLMADEEGYGTDWGVWGGHPLRPMRRR